ncbi:phage regulatory CII family protein [Sphingomonas montanisoli]|uniref:Uncharacterized protein n=1 Tax=Sphingomonas montanisoli TaxID=2606412 RepID=A0A5D9C4R3_9SPHN|nr:phage regulatory CII family protein [Sphingomonas montanisoli]TZG26486.1 hypothetical protein FYJ91_16310 [Sphingomonas montanisoli]
MIDALEPRKQRLKNAVDDLVGAVGGAEKAPHYTRLKRPQSFGEYASIDHPDRWAPLDVIADLERNTRHLPGAPHVTRVMCAEAGGAFVKLPDGGTPGSCFHRTLAELTIEYGEVAAHLIAALGDGKLCADDVKQRRLIPEVDDALAKLAQLRMQLEAVEQGG